ncbi:16S rRNA processing protein RimM [Nonomuraea solani]|uniref:Ribosome maturation factor RimM n=1 Tax=Nonomuraea solani TaxID=1144553 RepID=A0A1H6B2U3_9ACTN|nr:16S rRNA processing protein RimM [Nonomuraea solani]
MEVRTDDPELRFAVGAAIATDPESRGPLVIAGRRSHKGVLLVSFEGIHDRDAADELRGTMLVIDSGEVAPSDDPDEFHDHELMGLTVETVSGEPVGEVVDILHHGQDLLVVKRKGQEQALIPFVKALVPEVDLEAGRLVVDPPEGLL